MLKLFKSSFGTTNDLLIVITPLIIFLSIMGWYIDYAADVVNSTNKLIASIITIIVMFCGCFSGWFYMVKKAIALSKRIIVVDSDRTKEILKLFCSLPKGISKLFLPILNIALISFLIVGGTYFSLSHFEIDLKITKIITIAIALIYLYLTMLWLPEVVYGEKNPYKALIISVKNTCKTLKKSFITYIYILFTITVITILNTLLMSNPFLYFFVLIFFYYFLVYIVVLLFTYYEQEYQT